MKTIISLLLLIISGQTAFSQDWNPFVKDQNSFYKQQYNMTAKIESFLMDSVLPNEKIEYLYFNAKSKLKDDCNSNLRETLKYYDWLKNPNKIDSLIKTADSLLFINDYGSVLDTFVFKPFSKVNESWETNDISIKCTEVAVAFILGEQDSIKTFKCSGINYDTIEFVLSKNHGFVKFLPFNEFIYYSTSTGFSPYFELIGYVKNKIPHGYIQPDFNDYFHLTAGDILYWCDYSKSYDITIPSSTFYKVDSITYVYTSSDSVYYDFQRTTCDENSKILNKWNYSTYYLRKTEGEIVGNQTSWLGVKYGYHPFDVFYFQSLYLKIENEDTITYAEYNLPGLTLDTIDCIVGQIMDYDLTVQYSTREGEIFTGTYSWGENTTSLIGSIIKGIKYGTQIIPTGINNSAIPSLSVYPNPVKDYLTIVSPNNFINSILIFDIAGTLISSENYNESLYLGNLKSGIYIVKILDANRNVKHIKISKQ